MQLQPRGHQGGRDTQQGGPVGDMDGRAGTWHLPLPLRRGFQHEGIVHRHAL